MDLPQLEFDWRQIHFCFLPENLKDFEKLQKEVDTSADLIGIAPMKTFDEFVDAIRKVSRAKNIKSIGTTIVYLTKIALQEIEKYGKTE